jgi:hypothetical protein
MSFRFDKLTIKATEMLSLTLLITTVIVATEPSTKNEMEKLVGNLISTNPTPKYNGNRGDVDYPRGYEDSKQKVVFEARTVIYKQGLAAFPFLIELLDDDRFSIVIDDGPAEIDLPVNRHSHGILRSQIEAYSNWWSFAKRDDPEDEPLGYQRRPSYVYLHIKDVKSGREWWEQHSNKNLLELQIIALKWTIAEEAKTPEKFTKAEKAYLEDKLMELTKAKEPLKPFFIGVK